MRIAQQCHRRFHLTNKQYMDDCHDVYRAIMKQWALQGAWLLGLVSHKYCMERFQGQGWRSPNNQQRNLRWQRGHNCNSQLAIGSRVGHLKKRSRLCAYEVTFWHSLILLPCAIALVSTQASCNDPLSLSKLWRIRGNFFKYTDSCAFYSGMWNPASRIDRACQGWIADKSFQG